MKWAGFGADGAQSYRTADTTGGDRGLISALQVVVSTILTIEPATKPQPPHHKSSRTGSRASWGPGMDVSGSGEESAWWCPPRRRVRAAVVVLVRVRLECNLY